MNGRINFRIAIRVPEIFYVLRNHESKEPDRFIEEAELIKHHQSGEKDTVSDEVQLGRDQINNICNLLKSTFTTDTKSISVFRNYIFNKTYFKSFSYLLIFFIGRTKNESPSGSLSAGDRVSGRNGDL